MQKSTSAIVLTAFWRSHFKILKLSCLMTVRLIKVAKWQKVMFRNSAANFKFCVLIPNVYYIYRIRADSLNRAPLNAEKHIHDWFDSAMVAISLYDKFMDGFKEFQNLELRYKVFELFASNNVSHHIYPLYAQIPAWKLDKLIHRELDGIEDKTALTSFLFSRMNIFHIQLLQMQQVLKQRDAQIKDLERQLSEAYNVFSR